MMPLLSGPLSSGHVTDALLKNSCRITGCILLITVILSVPASRVRLDPSGISFNSENSGVSKDYHKFVDAFGTDDYLVLAIKNSLPVNDPELKKRIQRVQQQLSALESILTVIDLGAIESSELLPLVHPGPFWDKKAFDDVRAIVPGFNRLISVDMKTLAFIVKIDNEILNGFELEKRLDQMKHILVTAFPEHPHCHAAGIPVLRAAFERYNLLNALVFGSLGLLFGALIAFYIFKTLQAGILVIITSSLSVIWILGIMGILGMALNLATGLSFGFILVGSTATLFHVISKYYQLLETRSPEKALKKTNKIILRPCLMCTLTTSAGFLSLTISPVQMICQAGIIISMGMMLSFLLTVMVSSLYLPRYGRLCSQTHLKIKKNRLDRMIHFIARAGFKTPGTFVWAGIFFLGVMISGIPQIQSVKHLTAPIIKRTQEAADLHFIDQQLSTSTSFSIVLESMDNSFESRKFWYDLYQFEKQLRTVPGIQELESLTPLIFHLAFKVSPARVMPEFMFHQIRSKGLEHDMIRTYVAPNSKKIRLIVHIQNQTSDQIEAILKQVNHLAQNSFDPAIQYFLSGQLLLLKSQTQNLVATQLKTLVLAFVMITALMIIQLNSIVLGLLSLIPNLFPLVTIFGIMGWCHIPLDPLTIFAAVISFGLSVDDSIHFLTQLKREIVASTPSETIRDCLTAAYEVTSRSLISTTAVLFLSALGLIFSPFSHVFFLGVLISSASIMALAGDLIFMPALILSVTPLNRLLKIKMKNQGCTES